MDRPNILLIFADQLRYSALACNGVLPDPLHSSQSGLFWVRVLPLKRCDLEGTEQGFAPLWRQSNLQGALGRGRLELPDDGLEALSCLSDDIEVAQHAVIPDGDVEHPVAPLHLVGLGEVKSGSELRAPGHSAHVEPDAQRPSVGAR